MVLKRERCGDCQALEGEYHELGCDLERCPFCGGQLISCDCCYEILNIDGSPGTRVYEFGITPEQRKQWERALNDKGRVPFIMYPNMCAKCGKLWPEMFSVPDKEWERYVEKGERDKMLCKPCYDQIKIWIDESRGTETGTPGRQSLASRVRHRRTKGRRRHRPRPYHPRGPKEGTL